MNLIPWRKSSPSLPARREEEFYAPLNRLWEDMDAWFNRFWTSWPRGFEGSAIDTGRFWNLDLEDRDNEFVFRAEVPGFEPGELDVQVSGHTLTVKAETQDTNQNNHFRTRRSRRYCRQLTLPPWTDPERIEAEYRNGVLEVHVAKTKEGQPKRIAVKV